MAIREMGQQQYLQTLEKSLRIIRNNDKLSLDASIEELCKVLLLKLYLERKGEAMFYEFVNSLRMYIDDMNAFYTKYFRLCVQTAVFKGWDRTFLRKDTFLRIIEELNGNSLFKSGLSEKADAFGDFLQLHYSGYLSEFSSPNALNRFIGTVLDTEKLMSLADPCCGLGGILVDAVKHGNHQLTVKGFDVNQRISNTANLQLLMYGCEDTVVECRDLLETAVVEMNGPYEAVAAHLPLRHRGFSIAGREKYRTERMFSRIQEDILISQILKLLKPGGIAALVVSDELLQTERREDSRKWISRNAQILNITRFEGLSYKGSTSTRAYNVVFLRNTMPSLTDECMATRITAEMNDDDIQQIALYIRKAIKGDEAYKSADSDNRYFHMMKEETWNVDYLFAREKMGYKYPTCLLRDLVEHDRRRADVEGSRNYKQLTVKQRGLGVVEREEDYTGNPTAKNVRYVARSGQIVVSSLDADKGATGIVPKELNGALVSKNYYLFTVISPEVDPDYLAMVLSSGPVLKQLKFQKRGYVMSRISQERIMSIVIPLPSLEEQRTLASKLMKKVKRVHQIQEELEKEQEQFAVEVFGEE